MASTERSTAREAAPSVDEVIGILKKIIAEDLDLNLAVEQIDENEPLIDEGLALDSVVLVQMIGEIEQKLGFEFLDTDLRTRSFQSLRTLAEVVLSRLPRPAGA